MTRRASNLRGITLDDVKKALTRETRPYVRKRLLALKYLLAGTPPEHAARRVRASATSVARWITIARRSGLQALLADERGRKPKLPVPASKAGPMREQLRAALEETGHDRMTRTRLKAVDQLVAGTPPSEAARAAQVTPGAVMVWLAKFEKGGVAALLSRLQQFAPLCPGVDGAVLRALAATEKNRHIARRLRAVGHLADGLSAIDAAVRERTNDWMVRKWLADFRIGGIQALLRDRRLKADG